MRIEKKMCESCGRYIGDSYENKFFVLGNVQLRQKTEMYCAFCREKFIFNPIQDAPESMDFEIKYCSKCKLGLARVYENNNYLQSGRIRFWSSVRYTCCRCGKNANWRPTPPPIEKLSDSALEILNTLAVSDKYNREEEASNER
jgi:uncharacterized protein with PIN domain